MSDYPGISKRAKTGIRITTTQVDTYALANSGQWFTEAMSLEVTRKWVEKAIDQGDDIYLIAGFHTASNARIVQESLLGREVAGQIKLPVGLTLAAIGAVAPLGNIVDPSVTAITRLLKADRYNSWLPENKSAHCSIAKSATDGIRAAKLTRHSCLRTLDGKPTIDLETTWKRRKISSKLKQWNWRNREQTGKETWRQEKRFCFYARTTAASFSFCQPE